MDTQVLKNEFFVGQEVYVFHCGKIATGKIGSVEVKINSNNESFLFYGVKIASYVNWNIYMLYFSEHEIGESRVDLLAKNAETLQNIATEEKGNSEVPLMLKILHLLIELANTIDPKKVSIDDIMDAMRETIKNRSNNQI